MLKISHALEADPQLGELFGPVINGIRNYGVPLVTVPYLHLGANAHKGHFFFKSGVLPELYRDKDPVFERMAANCPTNVFICLPDEVLNAMIIVFEGENASDKINAAKAAITNEMR